MENYHTIVIGSGPGGIRAALTLADAGKKVLVVEKNKLGGLCLNYGCIPTKVLLNTVKIYESAKVSKTFGVDYSDFCLNFKNMVRRKNYVINTLREFLKKTLQSKKIDIKKGTAKILNPSKIEVLDNCNKKTFFFAKYIIIASGSSPNTLQSIRYKNGIFTSDDFISTETLPKSIAFIGGGVISCEFATIFSALGTKCIIIEKGKGILSKEDPEISNALTKEFQKRGIEIILNAKEAEIKNTAKNISIKFGNKKKILAEKILTAIGRKPNFIKENLRKIGVKYTKKGITVKNTMQTSIKNIYAIGDVAGKSFYAYSAEHEGEVAAKNILGGLFSMDYRFLPYCIFTQPEIAGVGMKEHEAKKAGYNIKVGRAFYATNSKAIILGKKTGFTKVVADKKTGKILGVQIFGGQATKIIDKAVLALTQKLTVFQTLSAVTCHPVISEVLKEALEKIK